MDVRIFTIFPAFFCIVTGSMKGYKFQLSSTGAISDDNLLKNKLYLEGNTLEILCRICDPDSVISTTDLMTHYVDQNKSPTLKLYNSTWSTTYTFPNAEDPTTQAWKLTIGRLDITSDATSWLPSEQWKVRVTMTDASETFSSDTTLLDQSRDPLLQWSYGTLEASLPVGVDVTEVRIRTSPCSNDVALFVPTLVNRAIFIGTTHSSFQDGQVKWYSLGSGCTGVDCEIIDIVVVNKFVLLLNENGVYVSNDLSVPSSSGQQVQFSRKLTIPASCTAPLNGRFFYTRQCQSRYHEIYRDDLVSLLYTCQNGHQVKLYSTGNFSLWKDIYENAAPDDLSSYISIAYNYHISCLNVLYETTSGSYKVHTRLLENLVLDTQDLFPAASFPSENIMKNLIYHPTSHILYAYGDSGIWASIDGGNYFDGFHTLTDGDTISDVSLGFFKGVVVFTISATSFLYGKAGPQRLVKLSVATPAESGAVLIDHMNGLSFVSAASGSTTVTKTNLDLDSLLQSSSIFFEHPLAIYFLPKKRLLLYEHHPTEQTKFKKSNIGQVISFSAGGKGIIQDIYPENAMISGFLNQLHVFIIEPLNFETFTESPAQKHPLDIITWDKSTGIATLQLTGSVSAGDGWKSTDVTKTVVIPYKMSFLITSHTDDTHVQAKSIMTLSDTPSETQPGYWYIFNAGVDGSSVAWSLEEDECRYNIDLKTSLGTATAYELDVRDSLDVTVLAEETSEAKIPMASQQLLRATSSNSWLFKSRFHLSYQLSSIPAYENLTVRIENKILQKGVSVFRFEMIQSSMRCPDTSVLVTVFAGCPCRKRLVYHYPLDFTMQQFLSGSMEYDGIVYLHELEVNYRPPSKFGVDIPLSKHIYNADPSKEIPRNTFKKSQDSLQYNLCKGKTSRAQCGCTDDFKYSADAVHSDCRERVYRIDHPGDITPMFTITQPGKKEVPLTSNHLISIREMNDREPYIVKIGGASSVLLDSMRSNDRLEQVGGDLYLNPLGFRVLMNGSGLYHYRVEMMPGLSNCELYAEYQFYVTMTPIAYPLMYVLNFAAAIVIGGVLFVIYLYYLNKYHIHRVRQIGPVCPDPTEITQQMGKHPPDIISEALVRESLSETMGRASETSQISTELKY